MASATEGLIFKFHLNLVHLNLDSPKWPGATILEKARTHFRVDSQLFPVPFLPEFHPSRKLEDW